MKLFYIFALIITSHGVNASSRRLCGDVLVQVIESMCPNGTNPIPVGKRSVPLGNMYDHVGDDNSQTKRAVSFLGDFLMENYANSVALTRRRRNLLGIVEECCKRSCSFDTLKSYCL